MGNPYQVLASELEQKCREQDHFIMNQDLEIQKLKTDKATLVECVKFYADWTQMNHGLDFGNDETAFIHEDDFEPIEKVDPYDWREDFYFVAGKKARETLKSIGVET